MTKIIDGFAQPDIDATDRKSGKKIYVFIEDGLTLIINEEAILITIRELLRTELSKLKEIRIVLYD